MLDVKALTRKPVGLRETGFSGNVATGFQPSREVGAASRRGAEPFRGSGEAFERSREQEEQMKIVGVIATAACAVVIAACGGGGGTSGGGSSSSSGSSGSDQVLSP